MEKGKRGRSYIIGNENERTNLEVVKTVCSILDRLHPRKKGQHADLITFVTDRPGHDARYAIDPNRIRSELGWQPTVSFEKNLETTSYAGLQRAKENTERQFEGLLQRI